MNPKNKYVARTIEALRRSSAMAGSRSVVYVALGDSVTAGWLEHGVLDSDAAYPSLFRRRLAGLFPQAMISVVNAGLGGESADGALARLERDCLRHDPQLVTVCLGLNDARRGADGVAPFRQSLTEIVRRVRGESQADLLLVTPNTRGDVLQEDGTLVEYIRHDPRGRPRAGSGGGGRSRRVSGLDSRRSRARRPAQQPRVPSDARGPRDLRQLADRVLPALSRPGADARERTSERAAGRRAVLY
jgi:hypothetical protein